MSEKPLVTRKLTPFVPRPYQLPILKALDEGYKRVVAILPRRCLAGDTLVLLSTGEPRPIKDLVEGDKVLSWNGKTFVEDTVKHVWKTSTKRLYQVKAPGYPALYASADHKLARWSYGPYHWTPVKEWGLRWRSLQYAGISSTKSSPLEARFFGYILSDGTTSEEQQPKFTNKNLEVLQDFEKLAISLFPSIHCKWREKGNGFDIGLSNGTKGGGYTVNPVAHFLETHHSRVTKSRRGLPKCIWEYDEESLLQFFSALISADGNIYVHKKGFEADGRTIPPSVEITLSLGSSDQWSQDIYWLLRKMGIVPHLPYKEKGSNWKIKISKSVAVKKLLSIPIVGKQEAADKALAAVAPFTKATGIYDGCFRSRPTITPAHEEELWDIETTTHHNFVANGYVVHNSGKDITALNYTIKQMFLNPGTYYYVFPSYAQAKKVIWDAIDNMGRRVLDYFPKELIISTNSQEMKIRMKAQQGRESLFQLVGSDNPDSLRGTNPRGVVFSEYAWQDPQAYQIIRPILTANEGWMLVVSTPFGRNHFYEMAQIAKNSPHWFHYHLSLDDTQHIPLEEIEKERSEGIMTEDQIQQEYYCFPPGQEVLTDKGSSPIQNIKPEMCVLTHSGRYRRVLGVLNRKYKGPLVTIHSSGTFEPLKCTPNHPLRVLLAEDQTYVWKKAEDVKKGDYLCFPKKSIPPHQVLSEPLVKLMAWYITEGSCCNNAVQFSVGKGRKEKDIEKALDCFGWEYARIVNETAINYNINSVSLVDFLKSNCGHTASDKRIPLTLISGNEKAFFEELMKGDGCLTVPNRYIYSTISKSLAYQVQFLAHSCIPGLAMTITHRPSQEVTFPHGKTYTCKESYCLQGWVKDKGRLKRAKYSVGAPVKAIEWEDYEGEVYNLQIQHDESYVVGGRAVHNCSFSRGVEGAYYAKYMETMRREHRIGNCPFEPGFKVHTAWDIGVRDHTCIIFFQTIGQTIRIIDCYSNSKVGLEHYASIVAGKGYNYGVHVAPHDIRVKEWGSGITRLEKAKELGINFVIADSHEVADGIEKVRSTLPKVWIDETKCKALIQSLENYRQEWDNVRKVYKPFPLHDFHSHFADCMRYLAVSLPKTSDGLSAAELDRRYYAAMYGGDNSLPSVFKNPMGH